jgi:hypothetical protein
VAYVEVDQLVRAFAQSLPTGIRRVFADTVQVADGTSLINGADDLRVDADVAVLDTGIAEHPDLNIAGRTNCTGGPNGTACKDGSGNDGNGHGTHVAGTIGALDNDIGVVGVAPGARLWSVKVLKNNGSGFISNIVGGLDWVAAKAGTADAIEVVNMSLGCECTSQALDIAITAVITRNVTVVVAAGNDSRDASAFSPANHPDVITVSAIVDFDGLPGSLGIPTCIVALDDMFAGFSNFGSVIDMTAPGACIESTWNNGGYAISTGTSMASPHVAGAAALLAASGIGAPHEIRNALLANGNFGWTDLSFDGFQEPLLDTSNAAVFQPATVAGGGEVPPDPNAAPTLSIISPADASTFANGASITFSATASDAEDGDLGASVTWSSNQDGALGTGASITVTLSSDKVHVVTASVADSGGADANDSVTVTVGTPPPPPTSGSMYVGGIAFALSGPSLNTTVTVLQTPAGDPVSSATVGPVLLTHDTNGDGQFDPSGTCDLDNLLGANGRDDCWDFVPLDTSGSGEATYKLLGAPAGNYKFEVFGMTHTSLTYDPSLDQGNPSCSSGSCP